MCRRMWVEVSTAFFLIQRPRLPTARSWLCLPVYGRIETRTSPRASLLPAPNSKAPISVIVLPPAHSQSLLTGPEHQSSGLTAPMSHCPAQTTYILGQVSKELIIYCVRASVLCPGSTKRRNDRRLRWGRSGGRRDTTVPAVRWGQCPGSAGGVSEGEHRRGAGRPRGGGGLLPAGVTSAGLWRQAR